MRNLFKFLLVSICVVLTVSGLLAQQSGKTTFGPRATDQATLNANNIYLIHSNDGDYGGDGQTWFPAGQTGKSILFGGGFAASGYVNGELRTAWQMSPNRINEIRPGKIYMPPEDPRYRMYTVHASEGPGSWGYLNWANAVALGADFHDADNDGFYDPYTDSPGLMGSQMTWCVYHDSTSLVYRDRLRANPMEIEIHQQAWAYPLGSALENVIFLRYRLINKSGHNIDDVIFSAYQDADIGNFTDDLLGCDSLLDIGYTYNDGADNTYGIDAPAAGVMVVQGARTPAPGDTAYRYNGPFRPQTAYPGQKNLQMTSFIFWISSDPTLGDPNTAQEGRWYQQGGLDRRDRPIYPPHWGTGGLVSDNPRFPYSGDPLKASGWRDDVPGDKRMMINSGPFQLADGDSQDVIFAYIAGRESSALGSLESIKKTAALVQRLFPAGQTVRIVSEESVTPLDSVFQMSVIDLALQHGDSMIAAAWQLVGKPPGSNASLAGVNGRHNQIIPDLPGIYDVRVTGLFNNGRSSRDNLIFTALTNSPPQIEIVVRPENPVYGELITLDASGSGDADNDSLSFLWSVPEWLNAGDPSGPAITVDAPRIGTAELVLRLDDQNYVRRRTSTVPITVNSIGLLPINQARRWTRVQHLAVDDGFLYLMSEDDALFRLMLNSLIRPETTAEVRGERFILGDSEIIAYGDDRNGRQGVYIYDISNGQITLRDTLRLSLLSFSGRKFDIARRADTLFVCESGWRLNSYDVSAAPQQIGSYLLPAPARDVVFDGNSALVYSTRVNTGLISLDISNPGQFDALDTLGIVNPNQGRQLAYNAGKAALYKTILNKHQIQLFDVTDPANLQTRTTFDIGPAREANSNFEVLRLQIETDRLSILTSEGIRIYDITDLDQPREIIRRLSGLPAAAFAWHNSEIFTATADTMGYDGGLYHLQFDPMLDIHEEQPAPREFQLFANYPNPFNPKTVIGYSLSVVGSVRLAVFDILGRQVRTLVDARQQPGTYTITWDGRNEVGEPVASGLYFYRLSAGDFQQIRKMLLVR